MTESTCNIELIYSTLGSDPDLGEIVEIFVDEMADRIATLSRQFDASDWEALQRTAHQLKGAAGSYGFDAISQPAARLECALRNSEPEEKLSQATAELIDFCRRIRAGAPQ